MSLAWFGTAPRLVGAHVPGSGDARRAVLVLHAHPLMGGSADGPVEAEAAEAAGRRGVPALRLAFRGTEVGGARSEGCQNGDLDDAADDAAEALAFVRRTYPRAAVVLVGYSFGALAALRVLRRLGPEGHGVASCLLVAPPIAMLPRADGADSSPAALASYRALSFARALVGASDGVALAPFHNNTDAYARRVAAAVPGADTAVLAGAGHVLRHGQGLGGVDAHIADALAA